MEDLIYSLIKRFRPDLENASGQQRIGGTADVLTLLYTLPLAILGLTWLVKVSDWGIIRTNWQVFLVLVVLMYLFNHFSFFLVTEIRGGGYANTQGALDGMVMWSGIFLFGPTALWVDVFWNLVNLARGLWRVRNPGEIWNRLRSSTSGLAINLIGILLILPVYGWLGGTLPLSDLSAQTLFAGITVILLHFLTTILIFSGYIGYVLWGLHQVLQVTIRPAVQFFALAFALPALANPFAILAVNLYNQGGLLFYLFDMIGLLLVAVLARRLSQAAESNRLQSRQLRELERLGRAILDSPADASTLPALLEEHVPPMITASSILIWSDESGVLLNFPTSLQIDRTPLDTWLHDQFEARFFQANVAIPWWDKGKTHSPLLITPVLHPVRGNVIGGVYIELHTLATAWDDRALATMLPSVKTLSAQVASALHRAHVYQETLAMQKTMQELSLARSIQASFLPETLPQVQGWEYHAALEPARQIAGDFYDFIALPNGCLGIVIADVADKGLGPALYMALSSTLLRTFASQFPSEPARVFRATNQRILQDAHANLFVTVFYGVLDPTTGQMVYANAGHPPAIIFDGKQPGTHHWLRNTGMPLGIDPESTWREELVHLDLDEILMLYTDGVTDAQNNRGEFIERQSVLDCVYDRGEQTLQSIQGSIFDRIHNFVGDAPRFDDITLVLLRRGSC